MWGRPPFSIADNCAVDVRNLAASREWYKEKLGLREAPDDREEDSGRPFVDLHIASDDAFISLLELKSGVSPGADMSSSSPRIWKRHGSGWRGATYSSSRLQLILAETISFGFKI